MLLLVKLCPFPFFSHSIGGYGTYQNVITLASKLVYIKFREYKHVTGAKYHLKPKDHRYLG